jgi:hypothetical protein
MVMATTKGRSSSSSRPAAPMLALAALLLVLLLGGACSMAEARGAGAVLSRTLRRPLQRQAGFLLPKTGVAGIGYAFV